MNTPYRLALLPALLLASLPFIPQAAHAVSGCTTLGGSGPAVFTANLKDVWVPRDLPVGDPIITTEFLPIITDPANIIVECRNSSDRLLEAHVNPTTPLLHNLPARLGNGRFASKVLRTRIKGVGAVIEMGWPFAAEAGNNFRSVSGDNTVPYHGTNRSTMAVPLAIGPMGMTVTLVKTGPIAAGPVMLDEELAHGSTTDVPDAFRLRVSANLNQAQCTLKNDAVSADPVDLGSHTTADFPAKGTTTTSMPFHITLSDCEDDPVSSTATAYIYLTGTDGSIALDPKQGLFSLGNGSTAKGIGIQITDDTGVPVPLQEHVSSNHKLQLPITRLPYRAHFYQTDDRVTPGLAKGALDFTISYR